MPPRRNIAQHIKANIRIQPKTGCWFWLRYKDPNGYGKIGINYKVYLVHRVSYETFVGKIPKGLDLDHLCRNPSCCNPKHLEPVTRAVNLKRGIGGKLAALRALAKTHCPQGHPYDEINTTRDSDGYRACRKCRASVRRRSYLKHIERRRAEARVAANAYYWANRKRVLRKAKENRRAKC